MSQTADLEHLFQLEQILSLGSTVGEWSDHSDDSNDASNNVENKCTSQSDSSTTDPYDNSTTSFDPGGNSDKPTKVDGTEKGYTNEDSEMTYSKNLKSSENSNSKITIPSSKTKREILSYATTNCGKGIVFIACTGNESNNIPQLGSVILKPNLQRSDLESESVKQKLDENDFMEDNIGTHMKVSAYHIPWYDHGDSSADVLTSVTLSETKRICLVSCRDGSLFLIPLHVIFPGVQHEYFNSHDTEDTQTNADNSLIHHSSNVPFEIFSIPKPLNHQRSNPTALIVWSSSEFTVGIVGTLQGKVIAVDLQNGNEIAVAHPSTSSIIRFETMKDDTLDSTYLFITDSKWTQWRLLLEKRTTGYTWCDSTSNINKDIKNPGKGDQNLPPEREKEQITKRQSTTETKDAPMNESTCSLSESSSSERESYNSMSTETKRSEIDNNEEVGSGGRSRLAGFKQMSFASLSNIRQKISEGRRLLTTSSSRVIGSSTDGYSSDIHSNRGSGPSQGRYKSDRHGMPEALSSKVGGTRLSVQLATTAKNISQSTWGNGTPPQGMVLAGLFPDTAILTFHNIELEVLPQVAFKLPRYSEKVLVLDKLMVVTGNDVTSGKSRDENRKDTFNNEINYSSANHIIAPLVDGDSQISDDKPGLLSIVSSHHSEIHLDNSRSKEDPILQSFRLEKAERILGIERTRYRNPLNSSSSDTPSSKSSPDLEEDKYNSESTFHDSPHKSLQIFYGKNKTQSKQEKCSHVSARASHENPFNTGEETSIQSHSSLPPDLNRVRNIPNKDKKNPQNNVTSPHINTMEEVDKQDSYKIPNPREEFISQAKLRVHTNKIRGKTMFQDCLVITNYSIYILRLDQDPITLFIEAAMQGDVATSEKLAATFDLDAKSLLELAADIKLSESDFAGAIALYRLSGCKHLKAVLKFAASGHVQELLRYLTVLEKTPNLDVSNSDRIHLSNLTLMAYFQQALSDNCGSIGTVTPSPTMIATKREQFRERICNFLIENKWIDEMLAIKLGTEVREWGLLDRFCENRGLQRQLMQVLTTIFKNELTNYSATEYSVKRPQEFKGNSSKFVYSTLSFKGLQDIATKMISDMPMRERRGFLNCLVKTDNLLACIEEPDLGIDLLDILFGALPFLDETQLESAVAQTEPRRCGYRPIFLYPILLKSKQYFMNPEATSSSAPSSMVDNDTSQRGHQRKERTGYMLIQSMLNFYISAQLSLVKVYTSKFIESLSSESNASELKGVGCEYNPPKMSSCDVNLVKISNKNNERLDKHPSVDDCLLRQSTLNSFLPTKLYSTKIVDNVSKVSGSTKSSFGNWDVGDTNESHISNFTNIKLKQKMMESSCSLLATSPNHVLLSRPGGNLVMSWGSTEHGALGHVNTTSASRFSPPREVAFLRALNSTHSIPKTCTNDESDEYEYDEISSQECSGDVTLRQNELLKSLCPPITVFSLACGKTHSLALTDRGVYTWGSSKYGQLGLGNQRQKTKRPEMITKLSRCVVTSIACGHYHSTALDLKGQLWTWGWGVHGQLGLEDIEDEHVPRRVLQPQQLFDESICSVAAGYAHTMVSTLAGNVWVFGCGLFGQLGNGENKKSTIPIKVDFTNAINSEGVMNDRIGKIACGFFHNLAVSQDGIRLYTWGCNPQLLRQEAQQKKKERLQNALIGKINSASNALKGNDPSRNAVSTNSLKSKAELTTVDGSRQNKSPVQSDTKDISTSPTSFHEQKSINKEKEEKDNEMIHLIPSLLDTSMIKGKIIDVACGNQHTVVLSSSGVVYSFGRNLEGQLGIGTRNREVKVFTCVTGLSEDFIVEVSCGGDYSAALSDSGTLFCWGHNSAGQLGKPPIIEDNQGNGKTEIIGSKGKVMLLKTSKLNSKITKLQHGTNYGILQNSCDIPKPILGLNSGVYSDESIDSNMMQRNVLNCIQRLENGIQIVKQIKPKNSDMKTKLARSRFLLHSCIEAFHPHLDNKKLIKKCLVSENPQAAAKISLLSNSNILQAFELTLQASIKQTPTISSSELGKNIFEAFHFYLHYKVKSREEEEEQDRRTQEKKQLTERLIACWQDQKFSFVLLETLLLERADPLLLQVLVLTLFCPENERDILDGPLLRSTDFSGPNLVNLFTPEFCLKVGDTFVKNVVDVDPDDVLVGCSSKPGELGFARATSSNIKSRGSNRRRQMVVSRWLEKQRSREVEIENDSQMLDALESDKGEPESKGQENNSIDFDTPFTNIEDVLNVLPKEFYASKTVDAKDKDNSSYVEESQLKNLVKDLILESDE